MTAAAPLAGRPLTELTPGQLVPFGGDRVTEVPAELAAAFRAGDRLIVVQSTGALLHVPADVASRVDGAVQRASDAFGALADRTDDQITAFYEALADRLTHADVRTQLDQANAADVADAIERGRPTARLRLTDAMASGMVDGLREWASSSIRRGEQVGRVDHDGWAVEIVRSPLGVVGFVFEGRPNVFADACGVIRTGNTAVLRIGSDALGTARVFVDAALVPALEAAGLPRDAVVLVDERSHASAAALVAHRGLALAVARGSGEVVRQLGAVAAQSGVPVSLHGTGGAWLVVGESAPPDGLTAAIEHSLDRKVCNTLNVIAVTRASIEAIGPVVVAALDRAASRARVHVVTGAEELVPPEWFARGRATMADEGELAIEWEWEDVPEVTVVVVDDIAHAVRLFNRYAPRFVASLISDDRAEHDRFFGSIDAPFVGDGFTRWVDGQYALGLPELGLANWEHGRPIGRGAILSGESIYTLRHRARVDDLTVRR